VSIRSIFFLLVLANLLVFAWTQGYFGESDDGREPQKLDQQLHPEKLRIVRSAQTAPARKEEPACRVINGLTLANGEALKAAVAAAGAEARLMPQEEPALHLVLIADLANKAAADKKLAELARLGIEGHKLVALEGGRHEIVLGSFTSETAARELLQALSKKGIKSAKTDRREQPAVRARVEARGAATTLLQQLPKLIAPYAEATLGDCPQ
jgi:hypothetical protein